MTKTFFSAVKVAVDSSLLLVVQITKKDQWSLDQLQTLVLNDTNLAERTFNNVAWDCVFSFGGRILGDYGCGWKARAYFRFIYIENRTLKPLTHRHHHCFIYVRDEKYWLSASSPYTHTHRNWHINSLIELNSCLNARLRIRLSTTEEVCYVLYTCLCE